MGTGLCRRRCPTSRSGCCRAAATACTVSVGAVAAGRTVSREACDRPVTGLSEGVRLPPPPFTEPFRTAGSWAPASPAELLVRCDELASGVTVTLPPRRPQQARHAARQASTATAR